MERAIRNSIGEYLYGRDDVLDLNAVDEITDDIIIIVKDMIEMAENYQDLRDS